MPITGRTIEECFGVFAGHVRALVASTVQGRPYMQLLRTEERALLTFYAGKPQAAPIDTVFGRVYFYLAQNLETVEDPDGFRLRTTHYRYRLQLTDDPQDKDALIRWEYDNSIPPDGHPRHHVHLNAKLSIGSAEIDCVRLHLPTGWVTMEEVIRFLIVELGMRPPEGVDDWADVLKRSETRFYEDFTGKRYKPATDA